MPDAAPRDGDSIVFFDIETVQVPQNDPLWLRLSARIQRLPGESEEDFEERLGNIHRKTTLNPALGRVWMIGYAVNKGEPKVLLGDGSLGEEKRIVSEFLGFLKDTPRFWLAGHNILGFDIPFLQVRALHHGLGREAAVLGRVTEKPWERRAIDTMKLWPRTSNDRSAWREGLSGLGKLSTICHVLGIPLQEGVMGETIYDAFKAGDTGGAVKHVREDIEQIREVFRRLWPLR